MSVPFVSLGKFKIAPFKNPDAEPYGGFANTTKAFVYPVEQNVTIHEEELNFKWPSSEHAYHAQKILHLKRKLTSDDPRQEVLTKTLYAIEQTKNSKGEEFLPSEYEKIVSDLIENNPSLNFGKDKSEFDALCDANYHSIHNPKKGLMENGEPYTLEFMRQVVRLKLEQNDNLKQLAIDCAKEGIMPVEISQYDVNWASGKSGKGKNMLGIILLELGNEYLSASKGKPKISNPKKYYEELVEEKENDLMHDNLVKCTNDMKHSKWLLPKESINSNLKQSPLKKESPEEYIQNYLAKKGFKSSLVEVVQDDKKPLQKVVKLTFNNKEDADSFRAKYSGLNTHVSKDGTKLFLGPDRAPKVFKTLGIEKYGLKNPVPIMDALMRNDVKDLQKNDLKDLKKNDVKDLKKNDLKDSKKNDVKNLKKTLHYAYATTGNGRSHVGLFNTNYAVKASKKLSKEYKKFKGDALKTAILRDFKNSIANITDSEELKKHIKKFKETDAWTTLKTGQGLTTKLLGGLGLLKTSSVVAFEKIIEEAQIKCKNFDSYKNN